ncbi:hypothetical protein PINS_up020074 [Pythium insidiosum]|nr:hypothetical protein PINS_up020074 [Pythium insidiosum]
MMFRSNNNEATENEELASTKPSNVPQEAQNDDKSGKFSALKRKLFPSRARRHPVRVPPLVISPIAADAVQSVLNHYEQDGAGVSDDQRSEDEMQVEAEQAPAPAAFPSTSVTDYSARIARLEDEDDDDALVAAIESADLLQSASPEQAVHEVCVASDSPTTHLS